MRREELVTCCSNDNDDGDSSEQKTATQKADTYLPTYTFKQ
jgi:hypothetical protein